MNAKLMTALLTTAFVVIPNGAGKSQTPSPTPAVRSAPRAGGWPTPGANSFTEGQAQARLEAHGFENVAELQKDSTGIWRGFAIKQNIRQPVAVDFRGDVFSGLSATVDVATGSNKPRPRTFGPDLATSDAGSDAEMNRPGFPGGHLGWVMRPRLAPRFARSSALLPRQGVCFQSARAGGGC